MKNGMIRGIVAGTLVGAGALWAASTMTRGQRKMITDYANQAAGKVKEKANEVINK